MKKKYITIAKSLGIIIPACLLASPVEAKEVDNVKDALNNGVSVLNDSRNQSNPIKDRIVKSFNEEPQTTLYQIDHTNVHSDVVRHTDTHTDQKTDNGYINYHTNNTPPHVDTHSNVG